MIRFFVAILFLCFFVPLQAQVKITEEAPIGLMVSKYMDINEASNTLDGWRIQVVAKTDRREIEKAKEGFIINFPGVSVDWIHSKPYYRLRAGAFQTRLEAIQMLQELKEEYPGAFPVKDDISKKELIAIR
jgi:hypothetical protein